MAAAGYTSEETETIRAEIVWYEQLRKEIKVASGDYVDMKLYEPAMRHLLDAYIRAEDSRVLSSLEDMTLIQLVIDRGESALKNLAEDLVEDDESDDESSGREAMAESIENNVRRLIIDEMEVNPKYYERMSRLLDALIEQRRRKAVSYETYLEKIVDLTRKAAQPGGAPKDDTGTSKGARRSNAEQALYDNIPDILGHVAAERPGLDTAALAARIHNDVVAGHKAYWRGSTMKERGIRKLIAAAIEAETGDTPEESVVSAIFSIIKNQHDY